MFGDGATMDTRLRTAVKAIRQRLEMQQWDLGKAIGVSRQTLSPIEAGETVPSTTSQLKLEVPAMSTCCLRKIRFASACLLALVVAAVLPGCGSSSVSKPADAAIVDGANPNVGLDAAQPDTAADMPVLADAVPNSGLDAPQADVVADTLAAVDDGGTDAGLDGTEADAVVDAKTVADLGQMADGGGGDAGPSTACSSLVNPLYIMAGDCQVPALKTLGKVLRQSANPITLAWRMAPSCAIIDALFHSTPMTQIPSYIPNDPTWNPVTGSVPSCALESGGHSVDIGMPVGFLESCTSDPLPSNLVAFKGPIQSLMFVVPHSASPQAISSQQATLVFGTGSTANISPWLDENFYFILQPTMAVQVSLGALIAVQAAKWHGQPQSSPSVVANAVAISTFPEKTIGILGGGIFDSGNNRANLKALVFQAVNQTNGYLPDSTATAFDKRSLREGHYLPWNQMVYMTKASSTDAGVSVPANANAKLVIDILANTANADMPPEVDPVAQVAQGGLVPLCAMAVTRTAEGGNLSLFAPPDPCGCYFESKVGTAPASCTPCTAGTACAAGITCRHGFCEANDGRTSLSDCSALPSGATHVQIINNSCTSGARFQSDPIP